MIGRGPGLAWLVTAALLWGGCAFGYNRVLFVTKTNTGFEATSTPPTIHLAIARMEGVISPQFQNGAKLPVMASFRFSNDGFFAPAVGSAFATGDAAVTMAGLYADRTPLANDWTARVGLLTQSKPPTDGTVSLTTEPTLPRILGRQLTFQGADVRPVFFGTDTSLGIKIAWSGATAQYPDSARFGYNRTELAIVPIAKETSGGNVNMRMSSLMATIDAGVGDIGTAGQPGLNFQLVQYFATGRAATLMAMQQDVRKAMLARLDPHKEQRKRAFEDVSRQEKTVASSFLPALYMELARQGPNDAVAAALVARMDAAVPTAIASATTLDFKRYDYTTPPNLTEITLVFAMPPTAIGKLVFYNAQLARSVQHLETALADPALTTFNGSPLSVAQRDQLKKELDTMKGKLTEVEKRIYEHRTVFSDAFEYFYR
jgi:hypothetical protein